MKKYAVKIFVMVIALSLFACYTPSAFCIESDGDCLYTLMDSQRRQLAQRAGRMYEGDQYISGDNRLYHVISVDDNAQIAIAEYVGEAVIDESALTVFHSSAAIAAEKNDVGKNTAKKLICMYSTHSDECYVPDDGKSSKWENAGIYDVGNSLKESLEGKGIKVIYSEETFLPHDADAYNRSRSTAEELLKKGPDALLDIHRDAISADQYETTIDGEDVSMIRLFVGRSNQNSAANKAFAQEIKKVADNRYPGLIKDIYIGKGNYNQELYPQALLLEMGTHEIEKDKVINSTEYMAEVLDEVLYGSAAKAENAKSAKKASAFTGIIWIVGIAIVAAVIYALISTGTFKGMFRKIRRDASEISGGLFGKKPDKK